MNRHEKANNEGAYRGIFSKLNSRQQVATPKKITYGNCKPAIAIGGILIRVF